MNNLPIVLHWIPTICFPIYAQALNIVGLRNFKNIWMNSREVKSSGLWSEMCSSLHFPALNPPVAFESPNLRRNVYRSVLKTTLLTLKTAVIGSGLCQKAWRKAQTHHFSVFFPPYIQATCPLAGNHQNCSTMLCNSYSVCMKNEEHVHELIVAVCLTAE